MSGTSPLQVHLNVACSEHTDSWYEYLCLSGKGMIVANTPWSGHYKVPDAVWIVSTNICRGTENRGTEGLPWLNHTWADDVIRSAVSVQVAHTTQFVQPGWRFLTSPGACAFLSDGWGSVLSYDTFQCTVIRDVSDDLKWPGDPANVNRYVSPDGKDLSVVIETAQSMTTNTLNLSLYG